MMISIEKQHKDFEKEQVALLKEKDKIERKIEAHKSNVETTITNLKSALDVVEDCGKYYKTASDSIKRSFNQAIFNKILIMPDGELIPEYTKPFKIIFDTMKKWSKNTNLLDIGNEDIACQTYTLTNVIGNMDSIGSTDLELSINVKKIKTSIIFL